MPPPERRVLPNRNRPSRPPGNHAAVPAVGFPYPYRLLLYRGSGCGDCIFGRPISQSLLALLVTPTPPRRSGGAQFTFAACEDPVAVERTSTPSPTRQPSNPYLPSTPKFTATPDRAHIAVHDAHLYDHADTNRHAVGGGYSARLPSPPTRPARRRYSLSTATAAACSKSPTCPMAPASRIGLPTGRTLFSSLPVWAGRTNIRARSYMSSKQTGASYLHCHIPTRAISIRPGRLTGNPSPSPPSGIGQRPDLQYEIARIIR